MSLVERGKTWTQALLYGASPRLGEDTGLALGRKAKCVSKPCPADEARVSARREAELCGKRQNMDRTLVLWCEPATRQGETISLLERGKAKTQALTCGASLELVKEER